MGLVYSLHGGHKLIRIVVEKFVHEGRLKGQNKDYIILNWLLKKKGLVPVFLNLFFVQITLATKRLSMGGAGALRSKVLSGNMDRSIQIYHNMNKFLAAFFEHVRILLLVFDLIYNL